MRGKREEREARMDGEGHFFPYGMERTTPPMHSTTKIVEEFLVEQAFIDSQRRSRRCLGEYSHITCH